MVYLFFFNFLITKQNGGGGGVASYIQMWVVTQFDVL